MAVAHDPAQVQRVGARPAINRVVARARDNRVVASAGVDAVVALAAIDLVVAFATDEGVVARATVQRVVAFTAVQPVVAFAAEQAVTACATQQGVVARAAVQCVVAFTTVQAVGTAASAQVVAATATAQGVLAATAAEVVAAATTANVHRQIGTARAAAGATTGLARHHPFDVAEVDGVEHLVLLVAHHHRARAVAVLGHPHLAVAHDPAQVQRVGARPAVDRVVARAGDNRVVAGAGVDHIVARRSAQTVVARSTLGVHLIHQALHVRHAVKPRPIGRRAGHALMHQGQVLRIHALHPQSAQVVERRHTAHATALHHRTSRTQQRRQLLHAVHLRPRQSPHRRRQQLQLGGRGLTTHTNQRQLLGRQTQRLATHNAIGGGINIAPHRLAPRFGVVQRHAQLSGHHIRPHPSRAGPGQQLVQGPHPGLWTAHRVIKHVHSSHRAHAHGALHARDRRQCPAIRVGRRLWLPVTVDHRHHRPHQQLARLQAKRLRHTRIDCAHIARHIARRPVACTQIGRRQPAVAPGHVQLAHRQLGQRIDVHHIATGPVHPAQGAQVGLQIL